ncbi:hypothetical protein [Olegusella massiliensis]|nr:hypothetical protein [Olegusella massiliensis]
MTQDVESICYACELADAEAWWNSHYEDDYDDEDEYEEEDEYE